MRCIFYLSILSTPTIRNICVVIKRSYFYN